MALAGGLQGNALDLYRSEPMSHLFRSLQGQTLSPGAMTTLGMSLKAGATPLDPLSLHRSPVAYATLALLLLPGCEDQPSTQDFYVEPAAPDNPTAQTEAEAERVAEREVLPEVSPVLSVGGSSTTGELTVTPAVAGGVLLGIRVDGLPEAQEFPAHVHRGVCAEGGPVAAALNSVTRLADGSGTSETALEAGVLPVTEPLFVQIHGPTGTPIACGDIVEE